MLEWQPEICVYHGNCDDGFGAAWAIWKRWPMCQFFAAHYGKPLPNAAGKRVLFVDFAPHRAELDAMAQTAASIVIIDHHKTAEADLAPFVVTLCGEARFSSHDITHMFRDMFELGRPAILAWFDMNQSGATMAWQFAHGTDRNENSCPMLLTYIEDRDLWRFSFARTKEVSAALRTYPMEFETWDALAKNVHGLIDEGVIVLRAHRANIKKIMRESYIADVAGYSVPVVNAPYHYASDIAHALLDEHPEAPFTAYWFRRADGVIQWSLRSEYNRLDVSEIAKAMGGGGHRNAAGFQQSAGEIHG